MWTVSSLVDHFDPPRRPDQQTAAVCEFVPVVLWLTRLARDKDALPPQELGDGLDWHLNRLESRQAAAEQRGVIESG